MNIRSKLSNAAARVGETAQRVRSTAKANFYRVRQAISNVVKRISGR